MTERHIKTAKSGPKTDGQRENTHQAKLQHDSSQRWPVRCVSEDRGDTNTIDIYHEFRLRAQRPNQTLLEGLCTVADKQSHQI